MSNAEGFTLTQPTGGTYVIEYGDGREFCPMNAIRFMAGVKDSEWKVEPGYKVCRYEFRTASLMEEMLLLAKENKIEFMAADGAFQGVPVP